MFSPFCPTRFFLFLKGSVDNLVFSQEDSVIGNLVMSFFILLNLTIVVVLHENSR